MHLHIRSADRLYREGKRMGCRGLAFPELLRVLMLRQIKEDKRNILETLPRRDDPARGVGGIAHVLRAVRWMHGL